jgi:hypothetical protein
MTGLGRVAGAVTAVTGFEKGSGKTTFLNLALPYARRQGPAAVFTIGVDGAGKARDGTVRSGEIQVREGDVVMTTETFARLSDARFEVLEAVPGRTALGQLLLGRVRRPGSITLVGTEHFSVLAQLIARVREEGWVQSVLVDGAVNRITQVSALGPVQFAFTVRVDPANLARVAARIRAMAALAALPEGGAGLALDGPITADTLKTLPIGTQAFSAEDFTKFFLEPDALLKTLERYQVSVRRRFQLLCFAITLRDLDRDRFLATVGAEAAPSLLFNPFEAA